MHVNLNIRCTFAVRLLMVWFAVVVVGHGQVQREKMKAMGEFDVHVSLDKVTILVSLLR